MPQEEIYNTRDQSYSAWHRRNSTRRFVGLESAQLLAMIDLDAILYIEYDDATKEPLALIETAMDVNQGNKPSTITKALARRCTPLLPAYVLLYTLADIPNPADIKCKDIKHFRVKRVWPEPETTWRLYEPAEWAKYLLVLRKSTTEAIDLFHGHEVKQFNLSEKA